MTSHRPKIGIPRELVGTVKAAYNGGGKSAPPFRNIEIIRYRYLLYKHPYMGSTKSTYHSLPPGTSSCSYKPGLKLSTTGGIEA